MSFVLAMVGKILHKFSDDVSHIEFMTAHVLANRWSDHFVFLCVPHELWYMARNGPGAEGRGARIYCTRINECFAIVIFSASAIHDVRQEVVSEQIETFLPEIKRSERPNIVRWVSGLCDSSWTLASVGSNRRRDVYRRHTKRYVGS